jgi:serine/threonine-protein kinase
MPSLTPENRSRWLSELRADQRARWQRGERTPVEHYLTQHPDLAADGEALLDLIHGEVEERCAAGEKPSLDEYLARFPHHADALRRSWPQLLTTRSAAPVPSGEQHSTLTENPTVAPLDEPIVRPPVLPGLALREKLGAGGMGVVYRAHDLRLDQPRAVKLIRAGPLADGSAHDRFNREARAAARLDHEGVVRIFALGEHNETLYICMEYLEGGSLQARLRQGLPPLREAADLVRRLALAVQHAHDNRVLHRDLKPANVLLTASGQPKIADFGLAKLLDAADDLTQTGAVLGTPAYMAPEQAEGRASAVGERTDVWALGTILYECLIGKPPFLGDGRSATLELVRTTPPPSLRRQRPEIPEELEAICLKCLEKQPEGRYASAERLAADLQAWIDGKPTSVRPPRGLRRLLRGVQRRWRLTTAIVLLLSVGVAAGLMSYFYHPDYRLWRVQERLRHGEAVELIGATGKPAWSRFWLGASEAQTEVGPDGTFVVHGWPTTILMLLPDTCGSSRYRIRADVRHMRSGEGGGVGLIFAMQHDPRAATPRYDFLEVSFNDIFDAMDLYNRMPDVVRRQTPPPRGNKVWFKSRHYAPGSSKPLLNYAPDIRAPELFKPAGHLAKPGDWRTIVVEVSPERLYVTFNGKLVADVSPARVEQKDRERLEQMRKDSPDGMGFEPRVELKGGVGLFLYESYASFCKVSFEPLDRANDQQR